VVILSHPRSARQVQYKLTQHLHPGTMATSCYAATSTRFVASSSCRARTKRTLSINHPLALNATRIGAQSPLWAGCGGSSARSMLREISVDRLPTKNWTMNELIAELPRVPSARYWLEYLRRHAKNLHEAPSQSRKKVSTIMACAFCFLASASSATTGSQSSGGPNTTSTFNSGGNGLGPRKNTQPVFVFSKQKAEDDVRKVEDDARDNPYLVSEGLWNPRLVRFFKEFSVAHSFPLHGMLGHRRSQRVFFKVLDGLWRTHTKWKMGDDFWRYLMATVGQT
jgi:hypothetical protein